MNPKDDIAMDRDLQVLVESRNPASWIEGIAHVLGRRKELLMGELEYANSARVNEISHQIEALQKIGQLAGNASPSKPKGKSPRERGSGQSREEHRMELTRILTPYGWRKRFEEPVEAAQEKARTDMLARESIEANRSFLEESRRIIRFLDSVERDGQKATHKLRREALKEAG